MYLLILTIIFLTLTKNVHGFDVYENDIKLWFENLNLNVVEFNNRAAEIAWTSTIQPHDPGLPEKAAKYQRERLIWQHQTCNKLTSLRHLMNDTQRRQTYLLCRGPVYYFDEIR